MPGRKASGPTTGWDSGVAERSVCGTPPRRPRHFVGISTERKVFSGGVHRAQDTDSSYVLGPSAGPGPSAPSGALGGAYPWHPSVVLTMVVSTGIQKHHCYSERQPASHRGPI